MDPKLQEKQMKLEKIKKLKALLEELQQNPTPENKEKMKIVAEELTKELKSLNVNSTSDLKKIGKEESSLQQNAAVQQAKGMAQTMLISQLLMAAFGYAATAAKSVFSFVASSLMKINWGSVAKYAGIAAVCFFAFKFIKKYFDKQKDKVNESFENDMCLEYMNQKIPLTELCNSVYNHEYILQEVKVELQNEPLLESYGSDGMFDDVTGFMGQIITFKSNPTTFKGKLVSGLFTFLWVVCIGSVLWLVMKSVTSPSN